jgi:hypothetical protein
MSESPPNIFGEFLKNQLSINERTKGWSAQRLAKELSEDGGTVRAWLRGTRIPSVHHPCIEKLSRILNIDSSEIQKIQLEALKDKKKQGRPKTPQNNYLDPLAELDCSATKVEIDDHRKIKSHGSLLGTRKLGETMISMVRNLPDVKDLISSKGTYENQILLTFQSKNSIFYKEKDLNNEWQKSLLGAIHKGWKITHLIRLDPIESKRTFEFVSNSFRFFEGCGEYKPQCFNEKKILSPSYGLFLLPKDGLILFTSDNSDLADSAIYTNNSEQIEILRKHYLQLKEKTVSIFDEFDSYEQGNFVERIIKSDDEVGDRIIIARRLSEITRPIEWYDIKHRWAKELTKYLERTSPPGERIDFSEHIYHRKMRAKKLEEIDSKYNCRYIYPRSVIENFIDGGKTHPYYFEATIDERIQQLERMCELLNYKTYQMALVGNEKEGNIYEKIKPSFCEVQGNHLFFMEFWYKGDEESQERVKWFSTQERVVVRAFQEYLSKIWDNIPDEHKDEYYVRSFLNDAIAKLNLKRDKI